MKRSPLKQATIEQVLRWQRRPKTPIKRVSMKHRSQLNLYYKARKKFLAENSTCAVFPHLAATQVHHKSHRIGPNLLDESTWLPVSHQGHCLIHASPALARERGWLD